MQGLTMEKISIGLIALSDGQPVTTTKSLLAPG
jgi:hypothetical protein